MTHLVFNEGGEGEVVEQVSEESPDVCVAVFSQALVVEAVHLRDLSRLMVAAYEGHAFGVADFEGEKKEEGFDAVEPAIHKVA